MQKPPVGHVSYVVIVLIGEEERRSIVDDDYGCEPDDVVSSTHEASHEVAT